MWHNPAHMTAGHVAAAKSRKTPKHLIPHLKGLSMNSSTNAGRHSAGASIGGVALKARGGQAEPMGNKVKTGATPQMRPSSPTAPDGSTQQAMQQIKQAPAPFRNPRVNPITTAPPNNAKATMNVGNGKGPNQASIKGHAAPVHPPTGPTGGYKPKKNYGPVGKPSFYGSR